MKSSLARSSIVYRSYTQESDVYATITPPRRQTYAYQSSHIIIMERPITFLCLSL